MEEKRVAVCVLFLALMGSHALAKSPPPPAARTLSGFPDVAIEPSVRMRAEGFKWDHEIQVALPPSYGKTDKRYPVLWVTDGSYIFESAVAVVNAWERKYLPEMIVVGIGAPPEAHKEVQMRRTYDFTPGAVLGFDGFGKALFERELKAAVDQRLKANGLAEVETFGGAPGFLKFLVETVRPALAAGYRMSGDHTLFGDSGGGLFCTYSLLARPEAFNRYICGSPSLYAANFELFRMEERYAQSHQDMRAEVFFGAGEGEVLEGGLISGWGVVSSMARMAEILKLRQYPSLKLHVRVFPDEEHGSVLQKNLSAGLRAVWQDELPAAHR
jgi:predicted alpha/beta superfamily hydrolase